jgi:hypothetical protein
LILNTEQGHALLCLTSTTKKGPPEVNRGRKGRNEDIKRKDRKENKECYKEWQKIKKIRKIRNAGKENEGI